MAMKRLCYFIISTLFLCVFNYTSGAKNNDFKILKENGIPVALNPDHPIPSKSSPKDIIFNEVLTIGQAEGDPSYVFSEHISFTVDDKGNIYILDLREKTLRKFDSKGKHLLSFGREGQGPGEFTSPEKVMLLSNGHLMVFEGESQKFSCFTQEGKFVNSGKFLKLMSPPYFGFSNGNFIAKSVQRNSHKTVVITGVFNTKSELLAQLYKREMEPYKPWPSQDDSDSRVKRIAEVWSKIAFRPQTIMALDSMENIYFAFTDKYEMKIFSPDAQLKRLIRTGLQMLPVKKKDRDGYLNYWLPKDISSWNLMSQKFKNKIKSLIKFPEKKPAFLSIIPMDKDYLMTVREGSFNQNSLIDIFDPSGRFIIEKRLRFHIKEGFCRGGIFYTIYEDEEGNQFVKCYKYELK